MCGCGGSSEGLSWEEFERILRDIEEAEEAPIEVTEEFEKIEVPEEAEVE
jgi:hypothetical protein